MCWCFVPAGTAGPVATDVDVIHQSIAIQKALPWKEAPAVKNASNKAV